MVRANASYQLEEWTAATNLTLISSLQLADCPVKCIDFSVRLDSDGTRALPEQSWSGLRADQVVKIPTAMKNILNVRSTVNGGTLAALVDPLSWGAWLSDAIDALSVPQVQQVVPAVFTGLPSPIPPAKL